MRYLLRLIAAVAMVALVALAPAAFAACPPLLNHTLPRLQDNAPQNLCQFQGKVVLVVNTASYCGFTSQYAALEAMYDKYRERGLVVLGFPSNDFGQQEPGDSKEIADFCRSTYGVRFPMMAKTAIAEPGTSAFYRGLIARSGSRPRWNFHKYIIDRSGTRVESFGSQTPPDSARVIALIERLLAERP